MDWARAFAALEKPGTTIYAYSSTRPYDVSRNLVAAACLQNNAEWLFFLDSDVVCDANAILQLMRHNLPIVSGVYRSKVPPNYPLVLRRRPQPQPDGKVLNVLSSLLDWTPGEVLQVDAVPTGLLLIHRRVLERFQAEGIQPFEWTLGRQTRLRDELKLTDDDLKALEEIRAGNAASRGAAALGRVLDKVVREPEPEGLSEDFDFSVKAKNLGFPLHVDTSVVAKHETQALIVGSDQGGPGQLRWVETP